MHLLKRDSYGRTSPFCKEEQITKFPYSHFADPFAKPETALGCRAFELGQLRLSHLGAGSVLFRELPDSHHPNFGDHINYGKRLLTEIVGLQVFLTHLLCMSRGEW